MRPFQCSIVVVLKSCCLRFKMANASATLATRFLPVPFLHAFAHGPVCCKSREHNILMSLASGDWCPHCESNQNTNTPWAFYVCHPCIRFWTHQALGVQQTAVWLSTRISLGECDMFVHVWTPKYVSLWFIDMHTQQKGCQILHHLGQVFGDRGLDESWETDTIQYARAHAAFTWVHQFAFLHTGGIVFPGATLRSFFACPWSPFLAIKIVSLTLDSKGFHRTLQRFYRTLPAKVLSNSTDLYRTPKKVP